MPVLVRELSPSDRPQVAFAFNRLGDRSRYQRYMGPKPALTQRELDRAVDVDHWHQEALIALSPRPRAPIGIARYVRGASFDTAEMAVAIVDEWQHRGVGRELLQALKARAIAHGIRRFTATMLWENRAAVKLARTLGPCTVLRGHDGMLELMVELA